MEVLLSAVASDLVGRLISFLIGKYHESVGAADIVALQRVLQRARVVVEEAETRQITNRAMLLQLNQLRGEMCRGSYMLDAFKRRAVDPRRRSNATGCRSFGQPPGSDGANGLSDMVDTLEAALRDMKEFVLLLGACPRLNRQPYSSYLFMERSMFGRQMEKEHIICFLLKTAQDFNVLPIIGPREVGKRTLVAHVCLEERVREHFANIHYLSSASDHLDLPSHEHHPALIDTAVRSLFVIDLADGDTDEEERWRRFHSSMRHRAHRESKIILISRREMHSCLSTMPPLMLRGPRREELWYFFRALAFGGADPEERPELVPIATALFAIIPDIAPFATANKLAVFLRDDLSARSWRRVLKVFAGGAKLQPGALPGERDCSVEKTTGYYYHLCMPVKDAPSAPCLFYDRRKSTGTARSELPKVTMLELLAGGVDPSGEKRFEVLLLQSHIPPYVSYVATCDMERAQRVVSGKRRLLDKRKRGPQQDYRTK